LPAMNAVAMVGMGVAGIIAGLFVVLAIAGGMVLGLVIPFLVMRFVRPGRRN